GRQERHGHHPPGGRQAQALPRTCERHRQGHHRRHPGARERHRVRARAGLLVGSAPGVPVSSWRPGQRLLACGALVTVAAAVWELLRGLSFDAEATLEYRPANAGLSEASWHELLATERAILRSR